jgi:4-hydroxyphenylpyruvate dioxygenase
LFRQGAINLEVNTETTGLVRSSFVTHGTTAYAIGLKVADTTATVRRAIALGATPFEQPVAKGDLRIPAVRGVGGGLIYFLDESTELGAVWEREFGVTTPPPRGAGLLGIDHIAQTMAHPEMLTWVLFYTSIFATKKAPMVDIIDPAGVVRSQAIENRNGTLRLTLNGADSSRTFAGRFVSETFGSSIQHLAFATSDILATATALAKLGFKPLEIGRNYYEDLAARFDLDVPMLTTLGQANILYDRDDTGVFLQMYSQTFGDGFFFEIVERQGGYGSYGGPNAPFRVAAQQREMRSRDRLKATT